METAQKEFPCKQCGAKLEYDPSSAALKCPYCGCENAVARSAEQVCELDLEAYWQQAMGERGTVEAVVVKCPACGAEVTRNPNLTADQCPFCGTGLVDQGTAKRVIQPGAVLPFAVDRERALGLFQQWITGLWFAPSRLKTYAQADSSRLNGMYVPYWTYDCNTVSDYTGQRGDDYWETEHYTTHVNGKTEHHTRQVRKTRWSFASGTVRNSFDDLLVMASESLPRKYAEKLEPWDLQNLQPYDDAFLSGFQAEAYQVSLPQGFEQAKEMMDGPIRSSIERDIGGDHQRISSVDTRYNDVTFKHILLPTWICAYRYQERTYRFLVNARTGEVQGERPWSWVKITLLVLAILAAIAVIALTVAGQSHSVPAQLPGM